MIFAIIFLVFQSFLVFKPKLFFVTYLLYTTSFLGFFSNQFIIIGFEIGLFYQNFLMMIFLIINLYKIKSLSKLYQRIVILILLIYFYGILKPYFIGYSSIYQSIIESKNFSTIFLLPYLLFNIKKIEKNFLIKLLSFFGYYFILILFIFTLFDVVPPFYQKDTSGLEFYYPTILSLFLFVKINLINNRKQKYVIWIFLLIWFFGMLKEGHTAIMITTLIGCLIHLVKLPYQILINKWEKVIILGSIFSLLLINLPLTNYYNKFNENEAISSRNETNEERNQLIQKRPITGYGFIHKSAYEIISVNRHAVNVSTIDSGYVDLIIKFGYLGTFIYLITLTLPFYNVSVKKDFNLDLFFYQFFLVNLTWSVFTYPIGLIALSMCLVLNYKNKNSY